MTIRKISFAAATAALYAGLTMALAPISYGLLQFRISEVLCVLPFFFPEASAGLFIGCIISNLLSAYGILDIVFGSLATLLASLLTMYIGKKSRGGIGSKVLACLPPVVFNAVIVGAVIAVSSVPVGSFWAAFWVYALQIGTEELVVMAVLGLPALIYLPRLGFFKKLCSQNAI